MPGCMADTVRRRPHVPHAPRSRRRPSARSGVGATTAQRRRRVGAGPGALDDVGGHASGPTWSGRASAPSSPASSPSCSSRRPGSQSAAVSDPARLAVVAVIVERTGSHRGSSPAGSTSTSVTSSTAASDAPPAAALALLAGRRSLGRLGGRASRASSRAPRRGTLGGPEHRRGGVLVQHPQPDVLDLVPDGRRALELQLLGGGAHLRLELGDQLLDLRPCSSRTAPRRSAP